MINNVLIFLSGKKGVIATILALTNGYLFQMGILDEITFYFIGALLVALFGTVSAATKLAYKEVKKIKVKQLDKKITNK